MKRKLILIFFIALLGISSAAIADPDQQITCGGAGDYCSLAHCGCSAPTDYYICAFNCACGASECSQSCDYCHV